MLFNKPNKYKLNMDDANQVLQNILETQQQPKNTVPFDKLVLRGRVNMRFYNTFLIVLLITLLLTVVAPFTIVPAAQTLLYPTGTITLVDDYLKDGCLYLQVEGTHILYKDAYLVTTDGENHSVISYDKQTGTLCFPYLDDTESNIYIPVKGRNPLHILISP